MSPEEHRLIFKLLKKALILHERQKIAPIGPKLNATITIRAKLHLGSAINEPMYLSFFARESSRAAKSNPSARTARKSGQFPTKPLRSTFVANANLEAVSQTPCRWRSWSGSAAGADIFDAVVRCYVPRIRR